jgi:hypothetical protein
VRKLRDKVNSNWGKAGAKILNTPTSFDEMVRRLNLSEKEYRSSIPLRQWPQKQRDTNVPRDLLEA